MKEMETQLRADLLNFYESYMALGSNDIVVQQAKKIYNKYIPAQTLISDKLMGFVARLFVIAYPNSGSGIKPLSQEEVKEIKKDLKNKNANSST